MTGPNGLIRQRCDPYGAESRIRLLGGLVGEEHLGKHMWHCDRLSGGTFRMVCAHGHRGQPMPLCLPGLVRAPDGSMMFHPGHVAELSRRQSDACPACLFPPEGRMHMEADRAGQRELAEAMVFGDRLGQARAKRKMLDAGAAMDELMTRGIVHKCPLHLEEVS
jgi:hypothetical protein